MKPAAAALVLLLAAAALLAAGCGSSGSSSGTTNSPSTREPAGVDPGGPEKPATGGGAAKEATAPNAPAGSKVTSCDGAGPDATGLRVVATDCATARATMARWQGKGSCAPAAGPRSPAAGESRKACALGRWRCQAVLAGRGTVVSCVRPEGGDVSFVVTRPPATAGAGR
jgi:hypothetical protein